MGPHRVDGRCCERGSMVPFVLLSFGIATVMVCGGITASVAFLAQRDVQSLCDGAAVAAANEIDESQYFATSGRDAVPLSQASVNAAVAEYLAAASDGLDAWSTSTDGRSVQVICTRYVMLPFAALFLGGKELERTAVASARSPFSP
ncbi:MAG: hypothetical protein H0V64_15665 [Geodermatophilaceae bacterium]|nr:hypothetical protein [Geodermatophilaceae bacterium]MDQ3465444.1 Tad domain-containing protein [Actinomycetota bacterium]